MARLLILFYSYYYAFNYACSHVRLLENSSTSNCLANQNKSAERLRARCIHQNTCVM